MNTTSPLPPPTPASASGAGQGSAWAWLTRAIVVLGILGTMLYGLAAIDAGIVNFRAAGNAQVAQQRVAMRDAADAGRPLGSPSEVAAHSSVMLALLAAVSSPTYAFGSQGLSEPLIHYATMPSSVGVALSVHNVLGGITMLFGALQFWPAFRRRFPRWHRGFGLIYILAAQCGMVAAMVFLARTPVSQIYDQFTFYVGLWGLAIGVTLTLWMAIYSMARKRIAQHQGWMAMNYGMLLTAPIQRYGWLAFGASSPALRQLEGNYAVTAVLIPLSVLIGYALFTLNRVLQADRPATTAARVAEPFRTLSRWGRVTALLLLPVLAVAAWTTVTQLRHPDALARVADAQRLIPAGVMALDHQVLTAHPAMHALFLVGTLLGLGSAAVWLLRTAVTPTSPEDAITRGAGWLLAWSSAAVGLSLIQWGLALGAPSFSTLHGGALHLFGGGVMGVFSVLMGMALSRGRTAWAREWSWFLVASLVAAPSLHWMLPVIGQLPIEPEYVDAGHAFRMAAYGQWMLLIGAFVCAIHSEATHAKLAR